MSTKALLPVTYLDHGLQQWPARCLGVPAGVLAHISEASSWWREGHCGLITSTEGTTRSTTCLLVCCQCRKGGLHSRVYEGWGALEVGATFAF